MTLVEILLVVSMIAMITTALYNCFFNGMKIWERTREFVVEEDVAVFFDKISSELRNTFIHSQLTMNGNNTRFSFPTIIRVIKDSEKEEEAEYVDQLGQVEYYYDLIERAFLRRQANYGQAVAERWQKPQKVISKVDFVKFRYVYVTDNEEKISDENLEGVPFGVEIEVGFTDKKGRHVLKRLINLPLNS